MDLVEGVDLLTIVELDYKNAKDIKQRISEYKDIIIDLNEDFRDVNIDIEIVKNKIIIDGIKKFFNMTDYYSNSNYNLYESIIYMKILILKLKY